MSCLRFITIIHLFLIALLPAVAQSRLDVGLLRQLQGRQPVAEAAAYAPQRYASADSVTVLLTLMPDTPASAFLPRLQSVSPSLQAGMAVGNVLSLRLPVSQLQDVAQLPGVSMLSAPRRFQPTCLNTRHDTHAYPISDATLAADVGLPQAYTGQGILLGIVDIGIEFGHLNFLHPLTGQTRLSAAVLYRPTQGSPAEVREYYALPQQIDTLTTDTHLQSHGTKTAGVAAGSYPGYGQQGMAPEATLMLCATSSLTDERLIDAMQQVFARADELNVPCVINLSIGNPVDWKDGLTPFCLACDALTDHGRAPGRIIVLSAGNNGDESFGVDHRFTSASDTVYALLKPSVYQGRRAYLNPNIDTYCSDSLPLSLDFVLYDTLLHTFSECPYPQHLLDTIEAGHSSRRHLYLDADTCVLSGSSHQLLAARYSGAAGSSISSYYILNGAVGDLLSPPAGARGHWLSAAGHLSISDLCCTSSVISVGAYSACDELTNVFSRTVPSSTLSPHISPFSSYGNSPQGDPLPDVIAPGVNVITSMSAFCDDKVEYYYTSRRYLSSPMMYVLQPDASLSPWYRPDQPQRTYYWASDQGTSFSSPVVAGIIALWLQACPTLSVADVRNILRHTSRFDDACQSPPCDPRQSGCGKVDALAGLRYILANQGIEQLEADAPHTSSVCYDVMGRPLPTSPKGRGQKLVYDSRFIISH